ncbi:transglycosylase SLT domain-containing protein [Pelagibacterium sp.]|uniref:transglycosylase SLT domain-containing protein n=1 Tax=Pelagibacterium sp. TaxID=1967288 RepID=UPI003A8CDEA7
MIAKRLIALFAALVLGFSAVPASAQSHSRGEIEILAQYYSQYYGVPLELVRRVINRESTFNPGARNGPYYGLMQILPATARTMGFRGQPSDLLNAETNLIYAVKYLRGAWLLANGSHDRAVQLYAKGYYYEAKAAGLLEETGLRPGPATPVAPSPPQFDAPVVAAVAPPPVEQIAGTVEMAAIEPLEAAFEGTPLGFLPPTRPLELQAPNPAPSTRTDALVAIAAVQAPPVVPARPQPAQTVDEAPSGLAHAQQRASSDAPQPMVAAETETLNLPQAAIDPQRGTELRPSIDLVTSTFALLDSIAPVQR